MTSRPIPLSTRLARIAFLLAAMSACAVARAHPISVTETYAYVSRDEVTIKISVFIEDLYLFHNLEPNRQDFIPPAEIRKGSEKHKQFLLERFVIRDAEGDKLAGKFTEVSDLKLEAEGVPLAELMMHKLTYEFRYKLTNKPEFLTFSQHLVDEETAIPAEMQLMIKQENAGTAVASVLRTDEPQTVRFNWDNPPLSSEASREEWESWLKQQKEETLGITSYSSVYSFLYIENHEVRHEILVPLMTLEESVPIKRREESFLDVDEQRAARETISEYFRNGNPIEINGERAAPRVDRIDFYGLRFKDFAQRNEPRRVSMSSARVGVILSYPTPERRAPSTVKLLWDRFNRFIYTVRVVVYAGEKTEQVTLSRVGSANSYEWTNPQPSAKRPEVKKVDVQLAARPHWSLPVVSLICLIAAPLALFWRGEAKATGATILTLLALAAVFSWPFFRWTTPAPMTARPRISPVRADEAFARLHDNLYRSFDCREESEIYDALAMSADGDLLRDVYLQIRRGLLMQQQGGAVARVREVRIEAGESHPAPIDKVRDERGFRYWCRWSVDGTVEHWGHVHSRTNQYEAMFTVEPRDEAWKITGLEILDEQRLKVQTRLRGM